MEAELDKIYALDFTQYYDLGDSGYNCHHYFLTPFMGVSFTFAQRTANHATGVVMFTMQLVYMDGKFYWATNDFKRKLR